MSLEVQEESVTSLGSMERKKPTIDFTFSRPQDSKHPSGFTPWQKYTNLTPDSGLPS